MKYLIVGLLILVSCDHSSNEMEGIAYEVIKKNKGVSITFEPINERQVNIQAESKP